MTARPVTPTAQRALALALFHEAVRVAHPRACVPPHLPAVPGSASGRGKLIVLGAGKANAAMAQAVEAHYAGLGQLDRIEGFVTTRHGFGLPTQKIEIAEAGHPVPDAPSAMAAQRALELATRAGPEDVVLVLMSGGASALWSAPVEGVTAADKQALTNLLSGGNAKAELAKATEAFKPVLEKSEQG